MARIYRPCEFRLRIRDLITRDTHQQITVTDNPPRPSSATCGSQLLRRELASGRGAVLQPYLRAAEYIIPKISVRTIREKAREQARAEVRASGEARGTSGALFVRPVKCEVRESRRRICASNSRKMYASETGRSTLKSTRSEAPPGKQRDNRDLRDDTSRRDYVQPLNLLRCASTGNRPLSAKQCSRVQQVEHGIKTM